MEAKAEKKKTAASKTGAKKSAKAKAAPKVSTKKAATAPVRKTLKRKRDAKKAPADLKFRTTVHLRRVRISPQRARLIVNLIKGKQVDPAIQILRFSPKKGARLALKLLQSAVANAKEQHGVDVDTLWVTGGYVNEGMTLPRSLFRAHGRANPISKRASHISLTIGEK